MTAYLDEALRIREQLIEDRRHLHRHPEVGSELPKTVDYVMGRLAEMGYVPREICKGGIVADVCGPRGDKTFLLRADMDALPMKEESGLPFSAQGNQAHTCGHDLHTAMLLGAARILKDREESLNGTVRLMFQPNEETLSGADVMIRAGVLENPDVDAAMALHVYPERLEAGAFLCGSGPIMASSDLFRLTLTGIGGHGAVPHLTVDPILVGSHIHLALQALPAREVDTLEPMVLTIGSFRSGTAPNIIPDEAVLEGTIRTFSEDVRAYARKRLEEIVLSTAKTFNARCEVEWIAGVLSNCNDKELTEELTEIIRPFAKSIQPMSKLMGSEDFALVAERIPTSFFFLGAGGEGPEYSHGGHNPKVQFNERCMPYGAAALSACAATWLERHG